MIKISVLIPTFNRAEMLKRTIESVLNQDYENLEIVVSDNNSKDNTLEIVENFLEDTRFKYYRNDLNIGMVNNWRKGVFEYISGDYFLIVSDDDYLIDDKYISKVVNLIENNENIIMVYSNGYLYFEDIKKEHEIILPFEEIEDGKDIFMNYLNIKHINSFLVNVVFNRKFAINVDSFNNKYNLACDMELFLKSCLCGNVGIIKEFSSVYTHHIKNLSSNLYKNYDYIINSIDHVVEPYNMALKYNKISNDEKEQWENRVILSVFLSCIAHTLFYFPEKYGDTLNFLMNKNGNVFEKLLNNKTYKFLIFINKIHIFKILYRIQNLIIQTRFKYQI